MHPMSESKKTIPCTESFATPMPISNAFERWYMDILALLHDDNIQVQICPTSSRLFQ